MLAALSVLERMNSQDHSSLDALLESIDARELAMGLIDVAGIMASMLSRASNGTAADVYAHVRTTILGMISNGTFEAGPANLPG